MTRFCSNEPFGSQPAASFGVRVSSRGRCCAATVPLLLASASTSMMAWFRLTQRMETLISIRFHPWLKRLFSSSALQLCSSSDSQYLPHIHQWHTVIGPSPGIPCFAVRLRSSYRHPAQPPPGGKKKTNVSRAAHLSARRSCEMRRDAICG